MTRPGILVLVAAAACSGRSSDNAGADRSPLSAGDSAFAGVQGRGRVAMGVDQYTSTHHFESLPDGGLISLERDTPDSAGVRQIRAHMAEIAGSFAQGNFAVPGFVHDRPVPGTAVMADRRSSISYRPDTLPQGASLRISSSDPVAVSAIHDFLAFQRRDHRAHGSDPH
ncbi:MAG: hypothetical protein ACJ8BF_05070 [Gemmatimonadales bacterium]